MFALLYIALIAAAEGVTALVNPIGGIIFHSLILFALVVHAAFASQATQRSLYLSLALAPLIRIISLSMPVSQFSQVYAYVIISIPVLVATLIFVRLMNLRPVEVGLVIRKGPLQLLVALTGVLFAWAEYRILSPEPLISNLRLDQVLLPAVVFLVSTGFIEELVFRGVMQRSFTGALGLRGLVLVALTFAVLHVGYLSAAHILFVFAVGLIFGWIVMKTGSILGVSLSHGITNIGLYLVIPLILR